ncbi:N-acetyltransferase [Ramlibacter sp.]|uniref:GNAT family N-acetyltransferase n=1 Tax=Ramlibacter sp. TaxID=1917967 RepID=UPI0017E69A6F|nr:N-acetyltransferase [Ramlibacter sp.]MBA2672626.1 GNAT family N-acetyltransferase [Ramlibacter sp.]
MEHPAVLRLARHTDAGAIAQMARELIEAGLTPRYTAVRIARHIADADTVALVAQTPGAAPQGFALMAFGDDHAHLVLLAVQPAARRQALGRALLQWLLASAEVAGMASVALELRADNDGAQAFYRALGFEATLLMPGYYEGRVDGQRMVRMLRAPGAVPSTPWGLRTNNRSP